MMSLSLLRLLQSSLVMSVVYQLKKIYGSKRPGYRLLIVVELQWLRYRSITSSSLTPTQQWTCTKSIYMHVHDLHWKRIHQNFAEYNFVKNGNDILIVYSFSLTVQKHDFVLWSVLAPWADFSGIFPKATASLQPLCAIAIPWHPFKCTSQYICIIYIPVSVSEVLVMLINYHAQCKQWVYAPWIAAWTILYITKELSKLPWCPPWA